MTLEEYLRRESESERMHEFLNGYVTEYSQLIYAAPDLICHGKVKGNLCRLLRSGLKDKPVWFPGSGQRIAMPWANSVVYPDASVFAGETKCWDSHTELLMNPLAIFEVVSCATEAFDRGLKFHAYRKISSLQTYVLISNNRASVDVYERRSSDGNQWLLTPHLTMDAIAEIPALKMDIALSDLYENVKFPQEDPLYAAMLKEQEAAYAAN